MSAVRVPPEAFECFSRPERREHTVRVPCMLAVAQTIHLHEQHVQGRERLHCVWGSRPRRYRMSIVCLYRWMPSQSNEVQPSFMTSSPAHTYCDNHGHAVGMCGQVALKRGQSACGRLCSYSYRCQWLTCIPRRARLTGHCSDTR